MKKLNVTSFVDLIKTVSRVQNDFHGARKDIFGSILRREFRVRNVPPTQRSACATSRLRNVPPTQRPAYATFRIRNVGTERADALSC